VPQTVEPTHKAVIKNVLVIDKEAKRTLVQRIITSPSFVKSERLSSFLVYVCDLEQNGRSKEICEQQIGEVVFGRSGGYDPTADSIVRSHATRLRLRLDQYFLEEGAHEKIRLRIPRGAYVPLFDHIVDEPTMDQNTVRIEKPYMSEASCEAEVPEGLPNTRFSWVSLSQRSVTVRLSVALVVVVAATFLAVWSFTAFARHRSRTMPPSDLLWNALFVPGRQTILVVGDGGANLFGNMARRQMTAEEYASKSWLREPLVQTPQGFSWDPVVSRIYTPYSAVEFAVHLARLPQVSDGQLSTLFARDIRLDDLKDKQAILLGSPLYNPWEQLLLQAQNFRMVSDGVENSISIISAKPLLGEPRVFKWSQADVASKSGYTLITLMRNLNGNGRLLLLQGTTANGDKAAGEFLFNRELLEPVLRKAMTNDGKLQDFQVVLKTEFVAGGNVDTRVVAFRTDPLR